MTTHFDRRQSIVLLGCGAMAWPIAARAQQPAVPVVGYLNSGTPEVAARLLAIYGGALTDAGFVAGQNVAFEYRYALGQFDRLPAMAADLVGRQVSVLVSFGGIQSSVAAKAATVTIPTVFITGEDPVRAGLVASLSQPGRNMTGVTLFDPQQGVKRMGVLREALPKATEIGILVNPNNANTEPNLTALRALAEAGGWHLHIVEVRSKPEIDAAFAALAAQRVEAFVTDPDPMLGSIREQIVALAARYAIPGCYAGRDAPAAGGLMGFGFNVEPINRIAGEYIARVLKGEKPADLPVRQPTKFNLTINLKTARALGLTIPATVVGRADEVIE